MNKPLAYSLRPETLDDIFGQEHLTGEGKILRRCIETGTIFSIIFFGPPGSGKTTLASVLSKQLQINFRLFNAVINNKKDLMTIVEEAKIYDQMIVIIEEIHRLNKDKQDLLLPHVEDGTITIIGTTTANPYFAINPAIRSRCHLLEVKSIDNDSMLDALKKITSKPELLNKGVEVTEDALKSIAYKANGDLRFAINVLEICYLMADGVINMDLVNEHIQSANLHFDHDDDGHYDAVSALQKSIRGSDVNAALYYLGRLVLADDLDSIERRLITTAYEDVGLANPAVVARAVQAIDAAKRIGFPEARIPLSMAIIELALSPKSKTASLAIDNVIYNLKQQPHPIPAYLRLTPVNMKDEDKYPYDRSDLWPYIQYLPDKIKNYKFYKPEPTSEFEKMLLKNNEELNKINRSNNLAQLKKNKKG